MCNSKFQVAALSSLVAAALLGPAQMCSAHFDTNPSAVREGVFSDHIVVKLAIGSKSGELSASPQWMDLAKRWQVVEVIPTFDPAPQDAKLAAQCGLDRFVTVVVPIGTDVRTLAKQVQALPGIELAEAEENGVLHTPPVNDPLFSQQWALSNTGQPVDGHSGVIGADINAAGAWTLALHLSPVTVAILDTGVSQTHPDLVDALVSGYNFTTSNTAATDDSTAISHGTYCAGVVAAKLNNALGVAGIAPNANIMPVKIMSVVGGVPFGSQSTTGSGITWAADHGAKVASMSIGWASSSATGALAAAIQYAAGRGMFMCASTGNSGTTGVAYPAHFALVMGVGGSDSTDAGWTGTSTGPEMKVVAPADSILTLSMDSSGNGYTLETGTSLACPIVAAIAALVIGEEPGLTATQVGDIITRSAVDLGTPGWDTTYGYGRVDAAAAIRLAHTTVCGVDYDGSGTLNTQDIFSFLDRWFANNPLADFDQSGSITTADVFSFLAAWFDGCPQ